MRIWHISDTHGSHGDLTVPDGIDMVIHSGDATNWKDPYRNESELRAFIDWFATLPIPHKIFVPGNHDTSLEKGLIGRDLIEHRKIHLLINEEISIGGLRIWGSPFTPRYGDWSYMRDRGTINRLWDEIPEGLDLLITHGPPYGVLDATYTQHNKVDLVGCSALRKRVAKVPPRFMLFGHVHHPKAQLLHPVLKLGAPFGLQLVAIERFALVGNHLVVHVAPQALLEHLQLFGQFEVRHFLVLPVIVFSIPPLRAAGRIPCSPCRQVPGWRAEPRLRKAGCSFRILTKAFT
jgi:Icc-related predicted phosphoesterase